MLKNIIVSLVNIIFPARCFLCNKIQLDPGLCSSCWSEVEFYEEQSCRICGIPLLQITEGEASCGKCLMEPPSYDKAVFVFKYDQNSNKLIHQFKYSDKLYYAKYFAVWMNRIGKEIILNTDIIIPVPLHRWRLLKRKFNQSAILAKILADKNKKRYIPNLLIRTKNNKQQTGLTRRQRRKNVQGIFKINKSKASLIKDKNILIIDDVMTTGATIEACAKLLKAACCKEVYVLTVARTVE